MPFQRYTEEQVLQANQVNLIEYAKAHGYPVREYHKGYYKIEGFGGLLLSPEKNSWYWEAESSASGKAGGGPIQFVMKLEHKSWVEAVNILLKESVTCPTFHPPEMPNKLQQKSIFRLPARNDTYKHVFAYLVNARQIDQQLVQQMVKNKKLYEDKHNNCVFVGYDEMGIARFASMRGTNTHFPFKGNPDGADKRYPVCWEGTSDRLYAFEAPIDMLSFITLLKESGNEVKDHYISLAGVSLIGLSAYLNRYPNISYIGIGSDYDNEGIKCFLNAAEAYGEKYRVRRVSPKPHKDFNEYLIKRHFEATIAKLQQSEGG